MIGTKIKYLLLLFAVLFSFKCVFSQSDSLLSIIQFDSVYSICDSQRIELKKDVFSFIFYLYDYNDRENYPNTIEIHCSQDQEDFNFNVSTNADSISFFSKGSGIATEHSKPYKSLFINNLGQHFIMYSKLSSRLRRAVMLEEYDNELYKLKWTVKNVSFENFEYSLKEIPINKFYFFVYSDKNNNGIIDDKEFSRFTLVFENDL